METANKSLHWIFIPLHCVKTSEFRRCASCWIRNKLIEEKELVARFGQEYIEYKSKTPFIIPFFGKNKRNQ